MSEIQQIISKIKAFRDERDWMQFHDPKNMAISIVLESSELLEHFQWKDKEEVQRHLKESKEAVQDEIADIALYLFELSDDLGINLIEAMEAKLKKNAQKYPTDKARGRHTKYTQL